ncbi:TRAP transporter large permease [Rhodothermus bifroesti]|uniref:TRAP transporter large permease n=1 Tax=Rhodothermus bifroesti TaxID=2823335 RepID=UPI001AEFF2E3|nr:TRAP transporter large permease subunit [Rhodothermus bifroesti]
MEWVAVLILIVSFALLLILGVPIAVCIGLATILTMLPSMPLMPALTTEAQRIATGLDSFTLLAIPFFVLAGHLMNRGGIAKRLVNFAEAALGMLPGALAHVNILAAMLFGAISGSAAAAASALGSIIGPHMVREGYDKGYGVAVNVTSATTGLLIPPSNILIVYSLASGGTSIAALFLAGYIPGILLGLFLMGVAGWIAWKRRYPIAGRPSLRRLWTTFWEAVPSMMLLVIVIGGIIAGIFTATEAAAVAVVYALLLALLYRELRWRELPSVLLEASTTTAIVLFLIATSMAMSWILAYEEIPQRVSEALLTLTHNKLLILLIINFILLAVGTFMDMTPAVLIFTPIFLPVALSLGIDPIHFGIIMVLNLCIGLCTPPVGTVLFVGLSVAQASMTRVLPSLLPMYGAMIIALLLVTYLPELSLWLPRIFGYVN